MSKMITESLDAILSRIVKSIPKEMIKIRWSDIRDILDKYVEKLPEDNRPVYNSNKIGSWARLNMERYGWIPSSTVLVSNIPSRRGGTDRVYIRSKK